MYPQTPKPPRRFSSGGISASQQDATVYRFNVRHVLKHVQGLRNIYVVCRPTQQMKSIVAQVQLHVHHCPHSSTVTRILLAGSQEKNDRAFASVHDDLLPFSSLC